MRKIIVSIHTTLDGFTANYEGFYAYWPTAPANPSSTKTDIEFSHWLDDTPKVIFSKSLDKVEWKNSRLVKGDVAAEISKLKQQPGKDMIIMNSTRLAHTFMQLGLIDEYWLWVHPVVIGSGRPLFSNIKNRINLKLLNTKAFSAGMVFLRYQTEKKEPA